MNSIFNPSEVIILADAKDSYVTILENPSVVNVVTGIQGLQGISGSSGNGSALAASFSWGDAMPAIIATIPAGKVVFKVELILKTAFDVSSNITIGDSADNTRLFNVNGLDLSQVGTYQSNPDYVYSASTPVNIYLTLGVGNSTGNGIILIYIEA